MKKNKKILDKKVLEVIMTILEDGSIYATQLTIGITLTIIDKRNYAIGRMNGLVGIKQ